MLEAVVVGASGYVGAEIARYLRRHPFVNIAGLLVSEDSQDKNKLLSDIDDAESVESIDVPLIAASDYSSWSTHVDVVFLATEHWISHDIAPFFLEQHCVVFDLSGAFRLQSSELYPTYYGFHHRHPDLLKRAVYGLAEWNVEAIKSADLIAVPGCYPTAAQLALRPLTARDLLDNQYTPIIYAVSGTSGAGRKSQLPSNLFKNHLQIYSLFNHRHQPEISSHLGLNVTFIPHLATFKRGVYQTIICQVSNDVTQEDIAMAFEYYYRDKPLVRLCHKELPVLGSVIGLPYCDIGFMLKNNQLVVVATEDNLLKGAAAQAVQCMNLRFGFDETLSLL